MSEPIGRLDLLTVEEYRALEANSELRHEYVRGFVRAMSGASKRHNRIILNIYRLLADAADGGPCRIYVEAVRTRVADDVFYYPDLVVACGEPGDPYEEEAPCLVIEVLSPSTEMTDLREKVINYRQNAGLDAYLIVHQQDRRVERHYRDASGAWQYDVVEQGDVPVPCPTAVLTLDQIYASTEQEWSDYRPRPRRVREAVPETMADA